MRAKLTLTRIKALTPRKGRDTFLWSTDLAGFGVKITPAGKRVFVFQYRPQYQEQKEKTAPVRLTLGKFGGDLTLDQATRLAARYRASVLAGNDPRTDKTQTCDAQRNGAERTVAALADRYLAGLERKRIKKTGRTLRPSTVRNYRQIVDRHIVARLGRVQVADVSLDQIEDLHNALAEKPYQANRALVVMSQLLQLAERLGWRPLNSNPTRHVARHPEVGRAKSTAVMLTPEQIGCLFAALKDEREQGADPYALGAIEVAFWTGWRLTSEILPLQWDDLDLDNGVALLRSTKTEQDAHRALPDDAANVLRVLPRIQGNPYVFPGKHACTHRTTVRSTWYRIRERAGLTDLAGIGSFRAHDLRHNAVSWHLATGAGLKLAGELVGHKSQQATEVYSHFLTAHLRDAANSRSKAMREAGARPSGADGKP